MKISSDIGSERFDGYVLAVYVKSPGLKVSAINLKRGGRKLNERGVIDKARERVDARGRSIIHDADDAW